MVLKTILRLYPDKQPFVDALAPLYASYEGTELGEYINKIRSVKEDQ